MLASRRWPSRTLTLIVPALLSLAALLVAPQAQAATPQKQAAKQNRTTVKLLPSAAKRLGAKQVRLVSTGLARGRGKEVWMPVTGGNVARQRTILRQGGGFEVKLHQQGRRARSLKLTRLELRLGKAPALIARPVGTRKAIPFFTVRHNRRALTVQPEAKMARLRNARLVPTPRALRVLRQRLGLKSAKRVPLATLTATADLKAFDQPEIEPPPLKPLPPEPQPLARPASAVDVTSSEITWCVRASWVRYTNSEVAPAVEGGAFPIGPPVDGAHACDQETTNTTSALLQYLYGFAPRAGSPGWYDPVTKTGALYFTGSVHFRYPERGIDLQFNDPEIELNGAASRQIFRFVGGEATAIPSHRVVMADLDPTAASNLIESPAGSFASGQIRAGFTAVAMDSVFAGFYPVGAPAGWVSVKFSIPSAPAV